MKHTHYLTLTSALIATMLLSIDSAAASSTCEELITTCFVSSPADRDDCMQTASATSICKTSTLYPLVSKRAQFATIQDVPQDGPAFLGPQIVDKRCLSRFDATWSAELVNGSLARESLSSLSAALDECAKADSPALPQL
ncbi:MAG: hypothetical protein RIS36_164 [Pseudomonadota bacterium]